MTNKKDDVCKSCVVPCRGVYAEIIEEHGLNNDTILVDDYLENEFQILLSEYQEYKRAFIKNYLNFFENVTNKGYPFNSNLTGEIVYV